MAGMIRRSIRGSTEKRTHRPLKTTRVPQQWCSQFLDSFVSLVTTMAKISLRALALAFSCFSSMFPIDLVILSSLSHGYSSLSIAMIRISSASLNHWISIDDPFCHDRFYFFSPLICFSLFILRQISPSLSTLLLSLVHSVHKYLHYML